MKKKKRGLTQREKLFCINYANSLNAEMSAINSGFKKNPLQKANALLSKQEIANEILNVVKVKESVLLKMAQTGFERLAFGSISDAVALLYMDSPTKEQLKSMDLFTVSEIKKLKDGAMEIKFFDRLKALDKLQMQEGAENSAHNGLMQALYQGAQNICDMPGDISEL